MRILYLTQYFNLPDQAGGSRHYQFARAWAAAGHDVTILCGHVNYKTGQVVPTERGKSYSVEEHPDGFRIVRLWVYHKFQRSFRKRLLYFASYAAHAALLGSGLPKPDVVFASSTPLTVGLPGLALARRFRVPFVFECRDLWPEAAVAAGVMKNARFIRAAKNLANFLYHRADRIVTVTRRMKEGILVYGVPSDKVTLVPNGVDDWMDPDRFADRNPLARFAGQKICLYVGAHGVWNYLGTMIEAAQLLRDRADVSFVFIGDGDQRALLEARARELGLARVHFLGALPKDEAFAAMVHADLGLITSSGTAHYEQILPNKIFDYPAARLPMVVAAAQGEMADLLDRSGAGWLCPPEDGAALAATITKALALPAEERARVAAAGRRFVLAEFYRPTLATRVLEVFAAAIGARRRGRRPPELRLEQSKDGSM